MRRSWAACRKREATGQAVELGAQAIDDLLGADLALAEGLEGDVDEAAVAAADKADDVVDGGIGLDGLDQPLDGVIHDREGGVLRALDAADQRAGVLLGKEALGDLDHDDDVERDDHDEDHQNQAGIGEDPFQAAPVAVQHAVEESLAEAVEAAVAVFVP